MDPKVTENIVHKIKAIYKFKPNILISIPTQQQCLDGFVCNFELAFGSNVQIKNMKIETDATHDLVFSYLNAS